MAFVLAAGIIGGYFIVFSPPANFPSGSTVSIVQGSSAPLVAQQLADAHIIVHPGVLRFILRMAGASDRVQAGMYRFSVPENLLTVAYRLVTGAYGLPFVNMTFPEGTTVHEMAIQIASAFPLISGEEILSAGKSYEGYLFPDTYFFLPSADATSIIATMRANFDAKTVPLSDDIKTSKRSLSGIVILASLVEKEARTTASKHIVAGILLNRLQRGMPLQVDAVFGYIYDRDTYSPSPTDLTVDSPYNTYKYQGLPVGPICNPGIESIRAAVYPKNTSYWYYLSAPSGQSIFSSTLDQHIGAINRYLK